MLLNSNNNNTVFYVKSTKGFFGPYPSQAFAEQMVVSGQIPAAINELPKIIEQLTDGREVLFG